MKISLINGSHRRRGSNSQYLLNELKNKLGKELHDIYQFNIYTNPNRIKVEEILNSEVIIIASPIYINLQPARVLEFMDKLSIIKKDLGNNECKYFYAISNCGFYEPLHNELSLLVYEEFCKACGFIYGGGIGIGCGELLKSTDPLIKMNNWIKRDINNALNLLSKNISTNNERMDNKFVNIRISKYVYTIICNWYWKKKGSENNLVKRKLFDRPIIR